jgi:hypothetical protein
MIIWPSVSSLGDRIEIEFVQYDCEQWALQQSRV